MKLFEINAVEAQRQRDNDLRQLSDDEIIRYMLEMIRDDGLYDSALIINQIIRRLNVIGRMTPKLQSAVNAINKSQKFELTKRQTI